MRKHIVYAILVTLALVGVVAGAALAQQGGGPDQTAREERIAKLREARNASIASFRENRSAAVQEFLAAHNATKASFMENKTRVLDECAAKRNSTEGSNASGCVRDGLKPLIEKARAEHKAQRQHLQERLMTARENAKTAFQAARAQYGPRAGSG